MSTHDDNDDKGLTPEERALARRLARLGPHGEPSAALDARILAAAHAATEPEPIRPRRERRRKAARWPAIFGVAASVALACGIAWQLRPLPEAPSAARQEAAYEEPLAEFAKPPPAPPMQMRTLPPKELKVPEPPPPAAVARAPKRPAIRSATPDDKREKPQAFDMPIVLDEAVHPRADAAAAAQSSGSRELETIAVPDEMAAAAAAPAPAAAPAAPPPPPADMAAKAANAQRAAESLERQRLAKEPAFAEPDAEVVPPATANDPVVRDAWLRRIRELLKAGDENAARTSLHAFRERYPRYVLPDDLRALEQ